MKIILLKDLPGVGNKYDSKNVADGYAQNYLIPRRMAEPGTREALRRSEQVRTQKEAERAIQQNLLAKNLEALAGAVIEIAERANEKGHLFSGIHRERIAEELKKQKRITLTPDLIVLPHPIKAIGEHAILVSTADTRANFKLVVTAIGS